MKTKTHIAVPTAGPRVTITRSGCESSTCSAPRGTAQTQPPPPRSRRQPSHDAPTSSTNSVPVHGARLHVHGDGAGPTTVVLIAGFNTSIGNWPAIEPTGSQTTRVCSYDRFPDAAPATLAAAVCHRLTTSR